MVILNSITIKDGTRMPYYETGGADAADDKRTVVFVHGIFGNARNFLGIMRHMPKTYRCVAFDMRGHGRSNANSGFDIAQFAADLHEAFALLSLNDIVLVGFSLGGFTVLEYVKTYGCAGISKIVLADTSPKFVNDDAWRLGLYRGSYGKADFEKELNEMERAFNREVAYFIYRSVVMYSQKRPYKASPPLWSFIVARFTVGRSYELKCKTHLLFKSACVRDHRDALPLIAVDTAIFYADPGSLFTPETALYMAERVSGPSRLVPFAHVSHTSMLSRVRHFVHALTGFINEG
jgi:pimeloyl-ACP methyl ester carboxylesterase